MIAILRYGEKGYYCSNCRIIQKEINQQCEFCGSTFTNYEMILTELYEQLRIKDDEN